MGKSQDSRLTKSKKSSQLSEREIKLIADEGTHYKISSDGMSIKVFIVDDHKILIDSFKDHFKRVKNISVVGYALSGMEAIEMLHPNELKETPILFCKILD